jgi:superfamily I DNA/RNA helicase
MLSFFFPDFHFNSPSGTSFYQREEIKDLTAYLGLVANPKDDVSMARVLNVPNRGIGKESEKQLRQVAKSQSISLYEAASRLSGEKWDNLVRLIDTLRKDRKKSVSQILLVILEGTKFKEWLQKKHKDDWDSRWENVAELATAVSDARYNEGDMPLEECLADIQLMTSVSSVDDGTPAVCISTMHASKGLEWKLVCLPALEQGMLPYSRALNEDRNDKPPTNKRELEELRLFFVSATRAKMVLLMSNAKTRVKFGKTDRPMPSSFLHRIPSELVSDKVDDTGIKALLQELCQEVEAPAVVTHRNLLRQSSRMMEIVQADESDAKPELVKSKSDLLDRMLAQMSKQRQKKNKKKKAEKRNRPEAEESDYSDEFYDDNSEQDLAEMKRQKMEAESEGGDQIRCVCGETEDDGSLFICCDGCNRWSHFLCHFQEGDDIPEVFYCCGL